MYKLLFTFKPNALISGHPGGLTSGTYGGIARDLLTFVAIGSLSKALRLALIRLPEVNFPQNVTLRMCVGCIQS